jgi:hypothetical protein
MWNSEICSLLGMVTFAASAASSIPGWLWALTFHGLSTPDVNATTLPPQQNYLKLSGDGNKEGWLYSEGSPGFLSVRGLCFCQYFGDLGHASRGHTGRKPGI